MFFADGHCTAMRDAAAARGKRTTGTNVLSVRASPIGLHSFLSGHGYVRNEAGTGSAICFLRGLPSLMRAWPILYIRK